MMEHPDSANNSEGQFTNIVHKLFNREILGSLSRRKSCSNNNGRFFERIPPRLRFCLMDIVPPEFLDSHIFMGFSQCGQFLLSFTYSFHNTMHVYFGESPKFTLHFLSWVPGRVVRKVHSVPLFGDEAIQSKIAISMAQWKHNPNVLVVYGIAASYSEKSCLSVVGVPRLGCRKCTAYTRNEDELAMGQRCLEHNFAVHTKFFCVNEPVVQLVYHNQIIIHTDYIHILEIDFVRPEEKDDKEQDCRSNIYDNDLDRVSCIDFNNNPSTPISDTSKSSFQSPKSQNNVVQNILSDLSDMEYEYSNPKLVHLPDVMGQELCIQASSISDSLHEEWEGPSPSKRTLISPPLRSPRRRPFESMSRFNENHRIIADKTYEFVEESEPKEKISMFRKRRLADKKYEFSENNENIAPFRLLRSTRKYFTGSSSKGVKQAKSPALEAVVLRAHNQISRPASPETSDCNDSVLNCDTNSETEYRITEMLDDGSLKTIAVHHSTSNTLSDIPVSPQDPYLEHSGSSSKGVKRAKSPALEAVVLRADNQISRPASPETSDCNDSVLNCDTNSETEYRITEMLDDGSLKTIAVHDSTSNTLSDIPVSPQDPYLEHSGNSKCSKFITRHFVESDDEITSIITDSEGSSSKGVKRAKSPALEAVVLRAHNQISRPASPETSDCNDSVLNCDTNSETEYRTTEMLDDGSLKTIAVHDSTSNTLSDIPVSPQDPYLEHSGNSKCSKFFTRYFVESDDEITSIITDSEDDCTSGYHVALHLTAHGAGYTPLQAVSGSAYDRICTNTDLNQTLRVQQRSLDTQLLCNEVCGRLCKINGKKFIYCFDFGCHVIDVCNSSGCLIGLCAMWLWASDQSDAATCSPCQLLSAVAPCSMHRRQYAAQCLFVWDLVSGEYHTERISMTLDDSKQYTRVSGADRARELAKGLGPIAVPPGNDIRILTADTGKSLSRMTDADNCIELTKNHPYSSDSECLTPVDDDESD